LDWTGSGQAEKVTNLRLYKIRKLLDKLKTDNFSILKTAETLCYTVIPTCSFAFSVPRA
jgi:hypothetical protein